MRQERTIWPLVERLQPASPISSEEFVIRQGVGAIFILDITAVAGTTPTLDVKLQWKTPSGVWNDWITSANLFGQKTAAAQAKVAIYPGLTAVANSKIDDMIPMVLKAVATFGADADEKFTFSLTMQEG